MSLQTLAALATLPPRGPEPHLGDEEEDPTLAPVHWVERTNVCSLPPPAPPPPPQLSGTGQARSAKARDGAPNSWAHGRSFYRHCSRPVSPFLGEPPGGLIPCTSLPSYLPGERGGWVSGWVEGGADRIGMSAKEAVAQASEQVSR